MYRQVGIFVWAAALACAVVPALAQSVGKGPKAQVELLSSVTGVAAGEPFDVALRFRLAETWHIYWQNSGDSGLPPSVTWKLPDGFTAGELQFPIPKRHVSPGDIVTNILAGQPALLVRITPPESIDVDTVKLSADVAYLICSKNCLREEAHVELTLPVVGSPGEVKPAHENELKRARRALPKESSKYLAIKASTQPAKLSVGEAFELILDVDIKRGYHIQSHAPLNPAFIKCDVFLAPARRIIYDEAIYPPPQFRKLKYVGKVSEYGGKISIRVPARIESGASELPEKLAGVFKYQACDSKGTCFPPDALAFSYSLTGKKTASADHPVPDRPSDGTSVSATAGSIDEQAPPSGNADTGAPTPVASAEASGLAGDDQQGLESTLKQFGLPGLLLGCFLYGLFINATPCVLPLLSIKVLGFVQQSHESRARTLVLGLAFSAGVLVLFVALGFFAAQGSNILQNTAAVIVLCSVVTALSLSMLGVYTLQVPTTAANLDAKIQQEGVMASFGKGALAPVLGFACTGPLMAGVFAFASQQPPATAFLSFLAAGVGMAFPYVLLGANPQWLSFLPKPGNWMITFERIMGFLLLLMVIWLLHPVASRYGATGLEWTLGFFVFVAMACWLLGRIDHSMSGATRWRYRMAAAALVAGSATLIYGWIDPLEEVEGEQRSGVKIAWQPWSEEAVREAVLAGHPAFVDITADYCTNCKANKAAAIYREATIARMEELGVVPFQADFSDGDPVIFEALKKHDRLGPPLNMIYPPGRPDRPIVLKPLFDEAYLLGKLNEAGRSQVKSASSVTP